MLKRVRHHGHETMNFTELDFNDQNNNNQNITIIGEEPNKLYCFRSNPIMFMYITIIVIVMNIVF